MSPLELLQAGPVIPVIVLDDLRDAVPLARALVAGGVRVLEITLRTAVALDAIAAIARAVPEAMVGAGTITRPGDFERAQAAGAQFGVTPGFTPLLAHAARQSAIPLLPGVMTPSEVVAAREAGYAALKLFPAQQAGGIAMLNALSGPFPDVVFCPTGGVHASNAAEYLALPNVACVGGSWLAPRDRVALRDWSAITTIARQAAALPRPGSPRSDS